VKPPLDHAVGALDDAAAGRRLPLGEALQERRRRRERPLRLRLCALVQLHGLRRVFLLIILIFFFLVFLASPAAAARTALFALLQVTAVVLLLLIVVAVVVVVVVVVVVSVLVAVKLLGGAPEDEVDQRLHGDLHGARVAAAPPEAPR
jgi:fatty acid desaturase